MADDQEGPLTESDFANIQTQLANLKRAEMELERAQRAGIDTGDMKSQANELRAKLGRIKQTYFPGR